MARFLKRGLSLDKPEQCTTEMCETAGRQAHSLIMESGGGNVSATVEGKVVFRRQGGRAGRRLERQRTLDDRAPKSRLSREGSGSRDMELMKEKFAKLLLGEDMSGSGKGVSSAVALSNAITNLAASVFSEQRCLEPMPDERKTRWRKEIDWLLSVCDHIVEFVPSQQTSKNGSNMEIMVTQQRKDLGANIPALRILDAMLIGCLDNFKGQNEFWYVSKDADESEKGNAKRNDDRWWLPIVKVPPNGLSEVFRNWLQFQKESVNKALKAAMAINAQVLMEMEVPEAYIEALPKNGRESLGDAIYRSITDDVFDPEQFLKSMDMSTEHKILDLKNRIEASVIIWKRKMHNVDGKSPWGSAVSLEKREQFEERAETILLLLKQRFPGIPQSALDTSKIQYNKDVGQSILEGYSRIIESLAFTVMSQIEDVLHADSKAQDPSDKESRRRSLTNFELGPMKKLEPEMEAPNSTTLSDLGGWHFDPGSETQMKKSESLEDLFSLHDVKMKTPPNIVTTTKKFSYIEKLESLRCLRSPTARH